VDGLAYGALPEVAEALCWEHPVIALVHHPLALETGLSADRASELQASERAALACAKQVVVTSATTGRLLVGSYGLASDTIAVVPPGSDVAAPAQGSTDGLVRLLAVGAVVPRKGYDVLVAALTSVADLPWRLTIAGDRTRDPACAARLQADIARYGLADRVAALGAVSDDRVAQLYQGADVFVLPSRFEGYGMAFAKALAHGLPVVGTTAGALPETVPEGAGILVPADNPQALASALRRLIENPAERQLMALRAGAASAEQMTWLSAAALFAQAIERAL
jgi:glycosyltransferase involved in cell wall biosynthesis